MQNLIKNIVAPVSTGSSSLYFLRQAAALAQSHGAQLHLCHIETERSFWEKLFGVGDPINIDIVSLPNKKKRLLYSWKNVLEKDYEIKVTVSSVNGSWKKSVLWLATEKGADLLTMAKDEKSMETSLWRRSRLEYIIEESACQVITFFAEQKEMINWKQIVLPVTECIPEARINTLARLASSLYMKVHLITPSQRNGHGKNADFYLLTETIKRLKPSGHIQVECRCLPTYSVSARDFLNYTSLVGADALITNLQANRLTQPQPVDKFFILPHA